MQTSVKKQTIKSLGGLQTITMDNIISVKIGKLGGRSTEYQVAGGANVQTLLDAARDDNNAFELSGYQLRVNGEAATVNTVLDDADIVSLIPAVKGG